jgi:hypothetical protein
MIFTLNQCLLPYALCTDHRGITFDLAILEEAAYIQHDILTTVIAPMLKVSNAVLIALSTHGGKENYFSKLVTKQDKEMDTLFIRMWVKLVCDRCESLGKDPSSCHHLEHCHPEWLVGSNGNRVKKLMPDDEALYAQEAMGAFWSNSRSVFRAAWLQSLRMRGPRPITSTGGRMITTFIDPAGGGSSRTAIVSLLREVAGDIVLVGMDEADLQEGPSLQDHLTQYFVHFQQHPVLSRIPHFLCVERNYGGPLFAGMFVQEAVRAFPRIREHRTDDTKHGTITTAEVNKSSTITAMWDLADDRVHFAPYRACFADVPYDNIAYETHTQRMEQSKHEFIAQLDRIHKEFSAGTGARAGGWKFTGKDNRGSRDDIAMCYLLATYYSLRIASMSKFGPDG